MSKIAILIAIAVAAGVVVTMLPHLVETLKHGLEWMTLAFTGHHISDEIAHFIHPQRENPVTEGKNVR